MTLYTFKYEIVLVLKLDFRIWLSHKSYAVKNDMFLYKIYKIH